MAGRRRITYRDMIEAIRKNGFEQIVGAYWLGDKDGEYIPKEEQLKEGGACAVGQMAYNLRIAPKEFRGHATGVHNYITWLNDTEHLTIAQIANRLEHEYKYYLDDTMFTVEDI